MGTWIQSFLRLPIPGSVIGMLLLFLFLMTGIIPKKGLESGAAFLLRYLPLILLPSVIGVMKYGHFFLHKGLLLVLLVIMNTFIIIGISSWCSQWLAMRHREGKKEKREVI
ncbi:holin-like protein [Pullulanibacillus pueri]|nr:holin-like protein [Pullulanibacillus pueri]